MGGNNLNSQNLSKSLYTKGIQCPKALWLKKYKPSVLTSPDESALAVFDTGNIVGDFASQLFPNGKEVPYSKNYDEPKPIVDDDLQATLF
jgi:hypothetical protein